MSFGDVGVNGAPSLFVYRPACHRQVSFSVDNYHAVTPVPSFGPANVLHAVWRARCRRFASSEPTIWQLNQRLSRMQS
jgi:hypothetical protein